MQTSLPFEHAVSIVRLTGEDAKHRTDHLEALRRLLLINEPMYPDIGRWVERKVIPGLRTGERVAYIGYRGEQPIASAVVKQGRHAKFCHLRLEDDARGAGLGDLFFALMAHDVRAQAEEIHFTLPESLWEQRASFFRSFGFADRAPAGTQYRLFDRELRCSAPLEDVWRAALGKLPRLLAMVSGTRAHDHAVLLSLKPRWAEAILSGRKRVEIRRVFSKHWAHGQAFLYSSHPVKQLVGEARIASVTEGRPDDIWERFGAEIGCTRAELDEYARGADQLYAIELEQPRAYRPSLHLADLRAMLGEPLRPPQSYATLATSPGWSSAVTVATLLGGEATPPSASRRTVTGAAATPR